MQKWYRTKFYVKGNTTILMSGKGHTLVLYHLVAVCLKCRGKVAILGVKTVRKHEAIASQWDKIIANFR
jgi:hypothetical protein